MNRVGFLFCALLALASVAANAEPIPNSSFADRTAGWFDGKGLTCPQICKEQKAVAESEKNTARPVAMSYVCKVRKAKNGPYLWLFGTQFDSRPACYTTDRDLKGEYSDIFYCLCVKQAVRRLGEISPGGAAGQLKVRDGG